MEVGLPLGYFYGYKTDGVFQNQAEVNAHPSQGCLRANAALGYSLLMLMVTDY
jgi:hypothetical protein